MDAKVFAAQDSREAALDRRTTAAAVHQADLGSKEIKLSFRIATGGIWHESHSFAPRPTTYKDFMSPGTPGPVSGPRYLEVIRGTSVAAAGAQAIAEAAGVTLVPLTWGGAPPAGPVQDEAFERIAAKICAGLSDALDVAPLDGIYLDLHGAGAAETFVDLEGELVRRIRKIVGGIPLTISLDPHANLSRQVVELSDAVVPCRTYPHIDVPATGARAMELLLERIKRGRPWAKAFRQIDFLIPLNSQCTELEPMQTILRERARLAEHGKVAELAFCFGFPYVDFPDCGPSMVAYADTQAEADAAAGALQAFVNEREDAFALDILPARAAVSEAIRLANSATRPIIIADTQDNPGGGGHGDTTGMLAELIAQGAQGAVLAIINDPETAAAFHKAGVGATLAAKLGGKSDGASLDVTAKILKLADGRFVCTGPMGKGNPRNLGPTALVEVAPGIRVIVSSMKVQASDQAMFRLLGIEPSECKILVLKSSVHFRADFEPIADKVIVGVAPGPVTADSSVFPFKYLRPGLRLKPRA